VKNLTLFQYLAAAFAALPDEVPAEGLDLCASYIDKCIYLYGIVALGLMGDMCRYTLHYFDVHGAMPQVFHFYSLDIAVICILAVLAWSKDRRVHAVALLLLYGFAYFGLALWTIK
jgi:hypothetical protein